MDREEFFNTCDSHKCLLRKGFTKTCVSKTKQNSCYMKYTNNEDSSLPVRDWASFRKEVWLETVGFMPKDFKIKDWTSVCFLWKSFTFSEKQTFQAKQINLQDQWLNKTVSLSHVYSRGTTPNKSWSKDNVVLIGSLFHTRLDSFRNPIDNTKIDAEIRINFLQRAYNQSILNRKGK